MELSHKAKERLASPNVGRWAVLLGVVLLSPSLVGGLVLDDDFHRARVLGADVIPISRLDLFDFCNGPAAVRALRDLGLLPWFATPDLKLAFFRPLASVLHYVEYTCWPEWPVLMHAHSLAWYALAVALAARLYARLVRPAWAAGLAAIFYAVAPGHGLPAAWIANRNAVIATALGLAALLAHDRWRRHGQRAAAAIGPACFAFALLAGETAIGVFGYVIAYAFSLDRSSRGARALAVAPYAAVLVVWQVAYRALGYGVHGSAVYLDVAHDTGEFARHFGPHAVALLLGALAFPPADVWAAAPPAGRWALTAAGVAFLVWFCRAVAPLVRHDRAARFWALGAVLAVVPACSAMPSNRMLLLVDLGALGLVAQLLAARASQRALGRLMMVVHLVVAPLLLPVIAMVPFAVRAYLRAGTRELDVRAWSPAETVVMVNAPNLLLPFYGVTAKRLVSAGRPTLTRVLASGSEPVRVSRPDAQTLFVRVEHGFLSELSTGIVRARALELGETASLHGLVVDVTALDREGLAVEARFRFDRPLDDPSFRWLAWTGATLVEISLPEVGAAATFGDGAPTRAVPTGGSPRDR